MKVLSDTIQLHSEGEGDIIDLTTQLSNIVKDSKIKNGTVTIFVSGSTAAVTTIEYEPGLVHDFPEMLSRIAPKDIEYEHDNTWHDGNGHSHVRSSLIGPSITIPIVHGKLTLGTWQQVVLLEMDTRSRNRTVILQIMGE
ncbi:MAG TPA: secondary thiamine-phosphate synthase enzyme YjbQ [Nitrososphaeraceae archaeon]|jgi:secondary thiamine-phosphate synthase enzyme|nr:secondary thiamine-phosphate synthase enzyme YjbQ [Nitrososphaeraceae archaeon]